MVALDVAHLPYNRPLLDYLREEYAAVARSSWPPGLMASGHGVSPITWAFLTMCWPAMAK